MSKREKWLMVGFIVLAILFLFSIPVKIAYPQEAHVGAQVIFKLDHRDTTGRYVLEAQEVRVAYVVTPVEGEHSAPLPDAALVLCRPYNEGPKYFLRCGMDRYAVRAISLVPKKEKE